MQGPDRVTWTQRTYMAGAGLQSTWPKFFLTLVAWSSLLCWLWALPVSLPSAFLILPYSGSQQWICTLPPITQLVSFQISNINAINGEETGSHQPPVSSTQHQLPSAVLPQASPCMKMAPHAIYICTWQNESGPLPTQEALPKIQLNEGMYVHICSFSEHVWGTKGVPNTSSRH